MAMINCKECNNEISSTASICPHCGAPTHRKKAGNKLVDAICIFTLFISIMCIMGGLFGAYIVPLFWLCVYLVWYKDAQKNPDIDASGLKQSLIAIFIAFFLPMGLIIIF